MTYGSLAPSLHTTADAARRFFQQNQGATQFQMEAPIDNEISYCPTLSATTPDFHSLCIEVTDTAFSDALDASFVLECMTRFLPVRLYIAIPKNLAPTTVHEISQRARRRGVGLVAVSADGGDVIHSALSLSLAGVRPVEARAFPAKYRHALTQAESTFRGGNPEKGCGAIYDEIEALSRRIAKKTHDKGWWTGAPVVIDFTKHNWAPLLEMFMARLDFASSRVPCPELKKPLIARVLGITELRNQAGHKPTSRARLIKRDKEARTRFEEGRDLLFDLVVASKGLRV
jgi:hypothetical protein